MPGIFQNPFQDSTQTVGTTAVSLGSNGYVGRAQITVFNGGGGGNLYIGGPNVTTATGFSIASNASATFATPQSGTIYAVASLPGTIARILEY